MQGPSRQDSLSQPLCPSGTSLCVLPRLFTLCLCLSAGTFLLICCQGLRSFPEPRTSPGPSPFRLLCSNPRLPLDSWGFRPSASMTRWLLCGVCGCASPRTGRWRLPSIYRPLTPLSLLPCVRFRHRPCLSRMLFLARGSPFSAGWEPGRPYWQQENNVCGFVRVWRGVRLCEKSSEAPGTSDLRPQQALASGLPSLPSRGTHRPGPARVTEGKSRGHLPASPDQVSAPRRPLAPEAKTPPGAYPLSCSPFPESPAPVTICVLLRVGREG